MGSSFAGFEPPGASRPHVTNTKNAAASKDCRDSPGHYAAERASSVGLRKKFLQ